MLSQEETYSISKAEHKKGTNRYYFEFSPHWRRRLNSPLSISVRSVRMWISQRALYINGLSIVNSSGLVWNISPNVLATGSMIELNQALYTDRQNHYETFRSSGGSYFILNSYIIQYNSSKHTFSIQTNTTENDHLVIDPPSVTGLSEIASADFKKMVGVEEDSFWNDLSDLTRHVNEMYQNVWEVKYSNDDRFYIGFNNTGDVNKIIFNNVWDRSTVKVQASFVDLAYDKYLGITNEQFVPPKEYNINYGDQKFYIELYSLDGSSVELPNDGKDQMVIEAIMNAY